MNIDDGIRSIFDFLKLHIAVITLKEEHVLKKAILILLCVLLLPVAYACEPADIPVPDDPIVILRDDLRVLTEDFLIPGNHDYFKDMDYYFEELKFLKQEYADRAGTQMTVTLFGREHTGDFCGHLTMGMAVAKDVITQECMPCYCSPEGFLFYYSEKAGRVVHFYSRKEFVELLREERPDAEELTVQQISDNCIKAFEAEYGLNGWVEINCEPSKYIRSGYKFTFARQQDGVNVDIIRLDINIYGEMLYGVLLPGRPAELSDSVPIPNWPEETYKELILKKLAALYEEYKTKEQHMYEAVFTDVQIHPNGYTYFYLTEYESHAIEVSFDCTYIYDGTTCTKPARMLILYDIP